MKNINVNSTFDEGFLEIKKDEGFLEISGNH